MCSVRSIRFIQFTYYCRHERSTATKLSRVTYFVLFKFPFHSWRALNWILLQRTDSLFREQETCLKRGGLFQFYSLCDMNCIGYSSEHLSTHVYSYRAKLRRNWFRNSDVSWNDVRRDIRDVRRGRNDVRRDRNDVIRDRNDVSRDRGDVSRDRSDVRRDRNDVRRDRNDVRRDRNAKLKRGGGGFQIICFD